MYMLILGKIIIIFLLWVLILFCVLFLINTRKIYSRLKEVEIHCNERKKELVHTYSHAMDRVSTVSKNIQILLNPKKAKLKDLLFCLFEVLEIIAFFQTIRYSLGFFGKLFKRTNS